LRKLALLGVRWAVGVVMDSLQLLVVHLALPLSYNDPTLISEILFLFLSSRGLFPLVITWPLLLNVIGDLRTGDL